MTRARNAVFLIGLAILGCWVALWGYVAATNRWGVFAVAPALLPLLLVSGAVSVLGSLVWVGSVRHGRWDVPLMLVTAAHATILLYAFTTR